MGVAIRLLDQRDRYKDVIPCLNGLAGNKDMFRNLVNLPHVNADWVDPMDCECILRPIDFQVWESFIKTLPNTNTFLDLLKRVQEDDHLWIEFCY